MKTRLALLALFVTSALIALLSVSTTPQLARADDLVRRPTPTPNSLVESETVSPDVSNAPEGQLPDLVVTDIRVVPNPPIINRLVTIQVVIANLNHADAPLVAGNNFFVDLYLNPEVPPRACLEGDEAWSIQATDLSTGQTTLSITFVPDTDNYPTFFQDVGLVRVWAQVDTGFDQANNRCGNVIESREDNNLRAFAFDMTTSANWLQTTHEDFQTGFSSALDLTEQSGVIQNGTGWFEEPRVPRPEENLADWPYDPARPWDYANFYNPDRHIFADNLPDNFPRDQLDQWNPADQEDVVVEVGFAPDMLFAVWEDARNGDLNDRDIYFSRSLNSGRTWSAPLRVNQDPLGNGRNQLNPKIAIDREVEPGGLYVFWEDNRLGSYDIFFARSSDAGLTWDEPDSNPVNDFNVDSNADQINVTVSAFNEPLCDASGDICSNEQGTTHLFVAWEDYRNANADIFAEWSTDGGSSWLKTPDGDPTTIDANIHVQPDPTTNAGAFEQKNPDLWLDRAFTEEAIDYCLRAAIRFEPVDGIGPDFYHYYLENPLPRVFIAWEDERDIQSGDPSNIYYTRGEFNYVPEIRDDTENGPRCPRGIPQPKSNLPPYRFEDDHVRANSDEGTSSQVNPAGGFTDDSFLSAPPFSAAYTDTVGTDEEVTFSFLCEVRFPTDEILINWQDNRDGTWDIWAANLFDDIIPEPVYMPTPPITTDPPGYSNQFNLVDARNACIQAAEEELVVPRPPRFQDSFTPQPPEFWELAGPETNIKINDWVTYTPKFQCRVPEATGQYPREPSQQTEPDLVVLPIVTDIDAVKADIEETFQVTLLWSAWADDRAFDERNQDILLRPTIRRDNSRQITVDSEDDPEIKLGLQVVQDNVKNQIMIRQLDLYEDYEPASVEQSNPMIAFHSFDGTFAFVEPGIPDDYFYVGWDDNRNANPFIGFEGNRDVFTARMILTDTLETQENLFELRPTRTATFISSVFDNGGESVWYDVEWQGDITADGVVSLQTRFGLDPDQPEPPQENVAANGWTQWTGIGGTGGVYTAPGQHITGPDGQRFPRSYYIQYRVNFNPLGLGQQGISCLREIKLNFEPIVYPIYLPIVLRNSPVSNTGTVTGRVTNATTGAALGAARVCDLASNQCTTSDFDGRYTLSNLLTGPRRVRATLDGFLPVEQSVTVGTGPPVTLDFALSPASGTVEGQVVSAVTGEPLGGARVCRTGSDQCATSGGDGRYTLSNVPTGVQRLTATLDGYTPLEQSVTVPGGGMATLPFTLSPILPAGEMRIVLTWGNEPDDLDSHLWLPPATPYHIFYPLSQRGNCDAFPFACLDVDDRVEFGPETTTIRQRSNGNYVYAIYQYTPDGALTTSGARVQVYNSSGLAAEYAVPTAGTGRWWHVFDLDGATGNITARNTISNNSPGPYDPDPRLARNGREQAKE
jgi:hypothetical protein